MRWNPGHLWRWLRAPKNRTVLGWLGGGLMILAGGAWTLITHFDKSDPTTTSRAQAHQGGVAIIGSANTGGGGISASYTGTTPPSTSAPASKPPVEEARPDAAGVPKPGQ